MSGRSRQRRATGSKRPRSQQHSSSNESPWGAAGAFFCPYTEETVETQTGPVHWEGRGVWGRPLAVPRGIAAVPEQVSKSPGRGKGDPLTRARGRGPEPSQQRGGFHGADSEGRRRTGELRPCSTPSLDDPEGGPGLVSASSPVAAEGAFPRGR